LLGEQYTAHFSFGGMNEAHDASNNWVYLDRTLTGHIANYGNASRTYAISYEFIQYGSQSREPGDAATLTLSTQSLTVPAGESRDFTVRLVLQGEEFPLGHYEGFIHVHEGGNLVTSVPFGAVAASSQQAVDPDSFWLTRDVVHVNHTSNHEHSDPFNWVPRHLSLNYVANGHFAMRGWVFRDNNQITADNWLNFADSEDYMGYAFTVASSAGFPNFGEQMRNIIFSGSVLRIPVDETGGGGEGGT
jgi:hypothetical protein